MMKNKYYIIILLGTMVFSLFGIYQMFLYDGIARDCHTNLIFENKEILSSSEISVLNKEVCSRYWELFKFWKYITLSSSVFFIMVLVLKLLAPTGADVPQDHP